jgi:hypothetical protein
MPQVAYVELALGATGERDHWQVVINRTMDAEPNAGG